MSGWDEYPIHQITQPLRVVGTTDARFYERYWFTAQDNDGKFVMMLGLGFYPNLGTADAFVAISENSRHTAVRAHRILTEDRSDISVGPIRAQVIEPFQEWHLTVGPNSEELEVDVRWRDTKRAVFREMNAPSTSGRLGTTTAGYETFGRIEGTIRLRDQTFTLSPATTRGSRDHHWGIRNGVGGPGHIEPHSRVSHVGQWVEFEHFGIWGSRVLHNIGSAAPGALDIIRSERKLKFDPETKHFIGGVIKNYLSDGSTKEVTYEQIEDRVVYLRFGMYMGPDDEAEPDTGLFQGSYVDDLAVAGSSYQTDDPELRKRISGFEDHLVTATCDGETVTGLIEVMNPVPYEMCRNAVPGYEFMAD